MSHSRVSQRLFCADSEWLGRLAEIVVFPPLLCVMIPDVYWAPGVMVHVVMEHFLSDVTSGYFSDSITRGIRHIRFFDKEERRIHLIWIINLRGGRIHAVIQRLNDITIWIMYQGAKYEVTKTKDSTLSKYQHIKLSRYLCVNETRYQDIKISKHQCMKLSWCQGVKVSWLLYSIKVKSM